MTDIRNLPGLKAWEIGKTCTGQGVGVQGPVFYRVTVEQYTFDRAAIERQRGLEMMIGNAFIASAMGPDDDIAKRTQKVTAFVGGQDAADLPILSLLEMGVKDDE